MSKKPKRHVRLFQVRFVLQVESGAKRRTIRKVPKRPLHVGDLLSLRCWTGKAYRSKQRVLGEGVITSVRTVLINEVSLVLFDPPEDFQQRLLKDLEPMTKFAQADGFKGWPELVRWFAENHGLPFRGLLIEWEMKKPDRPSGPEAPRSQGIETAGGQECCPMVPDGSQPGHSALQTSPSLMPGAPGASRPTV